MWWYSTKFSDVNIYSVIGPTKSLLRITVNIITIVLPIPGAPITGKIHTGNGGLSMISHILR